MKLQCTVTRVSNSGETIRVTLDGRQDRDADWRRDGTQELEFTCTDAAKRAFHLGRKVKITVEPL
jgi:hypothetical protein